MIRRPSWQQWKNPGRVLTGAYEKRKQETNEKAQRRSAETREARKAKIEEDSVKRLSYETTIKRCATKIVTMQRTKK